MPQISYGIGSPSPRVCPDRPGSGARPEFWFGKHFERTNIIRSCLLFFSFFVLYLLREDANIVDYKPENARDLSLEVDVKCAACSGRYDPPRRCKPRKGMPCLWFQPVNHMNEKKNRRSPGNKALPRGKKLAKSLFLFVLQLTLNMDVIRHRLQFERSCLS